MDAKETKKLLELEEENFLPFERITDQEIFAVLRRINQISFMGIIPETSLEQIKKHFIIRCKYRKIKKENQEKELQEYFKKVLVYAMKKSENLSSQFVEEYKNIFNKINRDYKITPTEELLELFIEICIESRIQSKKENTIRTKIQNRYKKVCAKKGNLTLPKDPIPKRTVLEKKEKNILAEYCGQNEAILYEIIYAFSKEEKDALLKCQTEKELFLHTLLLNQLNWGLRYYPLLKYFESSFVERQRILKRFFQRKQYLFDIEQNQIRFYKSFNLSENIVIQKIKKIQTENPELYKKIRIFLGYTNANVSILSLDGAIQKWLQEWAAKDLTEYSLFSKLEGIPKETIQQIVNWFQKNYKGYYEVLILKYGVSLNDFNMLNKRQEEKNKEAIEKIKKIYSLLKQKKITLETNILDRQGASISIQEYLANLTPEEKNFVQREMQRRIAKKKVNS